MKFSILVLCLLLAFGFPGCKSQIQPESATELVDTLYQTLRSIAFPQHYVANKVDGRFLLLMPGKVLNYFDYFPGEEYTRFIQDLDTNSPESVVPPHVMEKWFDLADTIPDPNPWNAQDSGKSLSSVYRSILHEMKILGLNQKTSSARAAHAKSIRYLNELVLDPENTTSSVPRLALYERYRDEYNDRKLKMEDTIEAKRTSVGSLEYELWFQRHYPSLQAKVESMYDRWLIFGDKENVELQIANMDSGTSGVQLEDARAALRAAGVSSLDRTRTIYPVSFEPSDWYKYLLPDEQLPSQDQLRLMYGKLLSKRNAISVMIDIANHPNMSSHDIEAKLNATRTQAVRDTQTFTQHQLDCVASSPYHCDSILEARNRALATLAYEAANYSLFDYVDYFTNPTSYISQLQQEKEAVSAQLTKIQNYLSQSSSILGGLLDSSTLNIQDDIEAHRGDEWLQFEYDQSTYSDTQDKSHSFTSWQASGGIHIFCFSLGGGASHSKETSSFAEKLGQTNMTVRGELLRVNIKRPWFKPELFEIPDLTFTESYESKTVYVSPGTEFHDELSFLNTINQNTKFKLPEFPTGLLLARKIEMEFFGMDYDTVTTTMNEMTHVSGSGGFLFFHASASYTKNTQTSHVQVKRTASGMKISIPGAQMIGYYTQVLPKFPLEQK